MSEPTPEFATDLNDRLMMMTLSVEDTSAVVVLMRDGACHSRKVSDVSAEEVIARLRALADEMEEETS